MILEWNILHRVDSLTCTPKNSNHLLSPSRATMALDHRRVGLENKSGRILGIRQVYFTKICQQIWGCVNQPFAIFIHHILGQTVLWGVYLSWRPRTECSISQFFETNCTQSIFKMINRKLLAKPFKIFPKSPIRPNLQCDLWSSVWMNINGVTLQRNIKRIYFVYFFIYWFYDDL